jgi:site-specific recombinase
VLRQHPAWRKALREYVLQVISTRTLVHLLTDTGITLNNGFWGAAWQRLINKFLPPLVNNDYVKDIFGQIFDHPSDHVWVNALDESTWQDLISSIGFRTSKARQAHAALTNEILSAVQVLSYRITNIGLEAELVRNYPEIERFESPFLRQNDEINNYVISYRTWLHDCTTAREDNKHIEVLLSQCDDIVNRIRKPPLSRGFLSA